MSVARVALPAGRVVPAPVTGAHLGTGQSGPVTVRLFRPSPTRIVFLSAAAAAQLLTMRAIQAGSPARVLSSRASSWTPLLQRGHDARLLPEQGPLAREHGPMVVVDEAAQDPRPFREVGDWQCLMDLRTLRTDVSVGWTSAYLTTFESADLVVIGSTTAAVASAAAQVFGLDERAYGVLAGGLPANTVALVRRAQLELVRVEA